MKHTFILLALCICSFFNNIYSQELNKEVTWCNMDGVSVPIPPKTHPRLYIRSNEISQLKERLQTPEAQQTIAVLKELSKPRTAIEEKAEGDNHGFRYYYKMRGITSEVQLQALDYLVNGKKEQAR